MDIRLETEVNPSVHGALTCRDLFEEATHRKGPVQLVS